MRIKLLIFSLLFSVLGWGQAFTGTYPFTSVTTSSGTTDPTALPTATGVTFSSFTAVGQTTANSNATGRFSFTGQPLATTTTSTGNATCVCDGAMSSSQYYQVTVTVASGYTVDLTGITFTLQRSGTGIRQYAVRSNADAYAANLPASVGASTNLSVVATNVFQVSDASSSAENGSTITLSGTNFTGLTAGTIRTFRFYGWNAEAAGGTFSIDNVVINGIATPISHTVTFNGNGADGGAMSNQTASTTTALTTNGFTRTGYTFVGWATSAGGAVVYADGANYSFATDITLYAKWNLVSGSTITVTQATGGTISPDTATYANGADQNFTASADSCYDFTSWTVDGVSNSSTANPYSFTNITTDHTITAVYTIKAFAINASAGANGSISPNGITNVNCGSNQTYTITPNAGYVVQDVLVDGVSVGAVTSYSFNNVTATHTISVSFIVAPTPCLTENFATGVPSSYSTGTFALSSGNWYFNRAIAQVGELQLESSTGSEARTPNINIIQTVTFKSYRTSGSGSSLQVNYSTDGGGTWTAATGSPFSLTTTPTVFTATINSSSGTIVQFYRTAGTIRLDDVSVVCGTPPPGPEMNVQGGSPLVTITDGDTSPVTTDWTDFGSVDITTGSVVRTFTIENTGTTVLNIGAITITGTSDFTVTSSPSATVAVGANTTFQVTFNPSATGARNASISIVNDDADENPYNFSITGNGTNTINNDLCSNATTLVVNAAPIAGDMTGSTRTAAPFNNKPDVWYTFTATCSSTHAITVSGFAGDIDIELFQTGCPSTTTFLDESNGTTSTETISIALTAGTTYYLRVLAFNAAAQTATFNVGVTAGSSLNISNTGSPATGNINLGASNVVIMGITTTPACATNYGITSITLTKAAASTVAATDISNFRIFYDVNSNGIIDGGEVSVSGGGIVLNNSMVFNLVGQSPLTTERRYLLVADVSPTAVVGRKIKVDLSPNSNLVATINPAGTKNGIALGNVQTIVTPSCTPATIVAVSPASGPVGTQVTITASSGNLTSATASFNGVAATIVSSSATQLLVTVPSGATTGNLIITDSQPCSSVAIPFTVVDKDITSCQSSSLITDLFISEVTDASSGSLTYVEIYNGTSNSIDMAALNYAVRITNYNATLNDGALGVDVDLPLAGVLAPGGKFIFGTTVGTACSVPGGNGSLANQSGVHSGINNNDLVKLVKGGTVIDVWGVADDTRFWITDLGLGDRGYDFERKNSVSAPSTTFNSNDWVIIDWDSCSDDYSNIATYIPIVTTPVITAQPTISVTCTTTSATLSVTANEGFAGGNPLAYQWYVVAPNTASWSVVNDGGVYSGATTANLVISSVVNLDGYQFYCQVRENLATCYTASTAVLISVPSTVWNGSIWTKGAPDPTKIAVIDGNYDTDTATAPGSFECCSLFVNTGYTLVVRDGDFVSVVNNITNNGTLNIDNNGSLVQVNDLGVNTGNINMQRTAIADRLDYVYWSTPVNPFSAANISLTSDNTKLYKWIPTVSTNVNGHGTWVSGNETMVLGQGYIERGLNNSTTDVPFTATFTGVPNNGVINIPISRGTYDLAATYDTTVSPTYATKDDDNWNLLGNPYPSSISLYEFLTANTNIGGFVKIWKHGLPPTTSNPDPFYNNYGYNYNAADYTTYNLSGSSAGSASDFFIGAGQGFIVLMNANTAATTENVTFKNVMRNKNYRNDLFFKSVSSTRTTVQDKGRIWLDIVSSTTNRRAMVGYIDGATNGNDRLFDAITDLKMDMTIYSLIDFEGQVVQGRALPFDQSDQVPLGIKVPTNGTYNIAIGEVDGFFTNPSQNIYLEDKMLNVIHDLRTAPYQFTEVAGIKNDRFVLRYTNQTLGNDQFEVSDNSVKIYASDNSIVINSLVEPIKAYEVYNVLGQTLASKKQVKVSKTEETSVQKNNQALIVKVTLENGKSFTKKVIY